MLAELLAQSGKSILTGIPPNGKDYWAARFWDRESAEQHPLLRGDFLRQKETIANFLRDHGGGAERVLEFACGTGEFTALAAEHTKAQEITALDISAEGLRRAGERVRHDNLRLVQGDFWADNGLGTSDLVMCVDAIHHLGDVTEVLTRLRTFVRPGGTLIGNLWTADHFHEFQRKRYGAVEHLRRTAAFFGTAVMIRASGGRLKTGAYRTQLVRSEQALAILHSVFPKVVQVRTEKYFMGFVCKV
ncbi:class I SAM-dependent methyltransferase [Kutzneria sp. NPDC052558]|uniref:class I SAM-dependent methyltransferase n=1 Tax=Kutzneria sp. NPDC052558 TaxID=3364121 RepID=UPI0037C53F06